MANVVFGMYGEEIPHYWGMFVGDGCYESTTSLNVRDEPSLSSVLAILILAGCCGFGIVVAVVHDLLFCRLVIFLSCEPGVALHFSTATRIQI